MARQRHYVNPKEPGVPLFVTTTVLDFVHAFRRREPRDAMVRAIANQCKRRRAALFGYVVMPHHIHLVIRPHLGMNGPQFMKPFKQQTGEAMLELLTESERREFDQQRGLNGNAFWQYSFRSVKIESDEMFWQKMNYIHQNPVAAGYVEREEDYRWSSARLVLEGKLSVDDGLACDAVRQSVDP